MLKPNEAMFETAFEAGARIGMLATFPPAVASMEEEFAADARRLGRAVTLKTVLAAGAMDALRSGDAASHNRLVAEAAADMVDVDVIMLAHFSTAQAEPVVGARMPVPVLTFAALGDRQIARFARGPDAERAPQGSDQQRPHLPDN